MGLSIQDLIILIVVTLAGGLYLFSRKSTSIPSKSISTSANASGNNSSSELASTGRDFVAAMKQSKKKIVIFYGSQTGTAEDYATKIAKEAKARYGLSSLVCDPEEYDFENLDQVPADSLVVFCVATYGEGESTDNAVAMMDFLKEDEPSFSNGGDLSNLNYVIFALGNSTYEQYCEVGKVIDARLSKFGATRVGERGEGDDDKSMEEDYLAWKDPMWEAVQTRMDWQEGEGGDSADFEVTELAAEVTDESKVFKGELSMRALTGTRGVYDAKNPYISPLVSSRELFDDGDRNCIFAEFDITDSGLRYQTGDHVGLWPLNPECQVERALRMVGLLERKDQVIDVKSLDPALAKVPFPVPTTYDTVFRHYLDICATASRQNVGALAKFAPHDSARLTLERLGSDKAYYHSVVAERSLKLADVLELADDGANSTWAIPFDRIISSMPRLQPRYYSISSSPKLHPNSIHITAVVLKYKPHAESTNHSYGVGTNYLLNLKTAQAGGRGSREADAPVYSLQGPRGKYAREDGGVSAPIHVRRSTFRLPTSPKVPVVMIGPGTGVAPFRAFVQDRVALARKAKAKDPENGLKDWGTIDLFYGCRRSDWDYLYKAEWEEYAKELDGKFRIHTAFSREPGQKKIYVQELIRQQSEFVSDAILNKKGYVYICGDAKHMAREVEKELEVMLGNAKGGSEVEGAKELKALKDRNRMLMDVWS